MAEPIPIFNAAAVQPALMFRRRLGGLKKLRKAPRIAPSRAPEIDYIRRINILLRDLSALVREVVLPKLPGIVAGAPIELRQRQDVGEELATTIGQVRLAFGVRAPLENIAKRIGNETEARSAEDQKRIVQSVLGLRPELTEPWLGPLIDQFAQSNAQLVGRVTGDFIDRLERKIADRQREGARAEEIAKEIERDFVSTQGLESTRARQRAKLIARDQTASLQADVTRVRQQQIGVERYIWRTAKDERVRGVGKPRTFKGSHVAREGEIFEWGKPIGPQLRKKGLVPAKIDGSPGKPIQCRCYAEPVLSDIVPDLPEI